MIKRLLQSNTQSVISSSRPSSSMKQPSKFINNQANGNVLSNFAMKYTQCQSRLSSKIENILNNNKRGSQMINDKSLFKHLTIKDKIQNNKRLNNSLRENIVKHSYVNENQNQNNIPPQPMKNNGQNQQKKQQLQIKMQNVSCLYSNYLYRKNQKDMVEIMKSQHLQLIIENQRLQKNKLFKTVQQLKKQINEKGRQNQTLLFAYRTLQTKLKEKEEIIKMRLLKEQKKKQLMNLRNKTQNQLNTGKLIQIENKPKRQINQGYGYVSLQGSKNWLRQSGQNSLKNSNINNQNSQLDSLKKIFQNPNFMEEWKQKQQKILKMQVQLKQLKEKNYKLSIQFDKLKQNHSQLEKQLQELKILKNKLFQKNIQLDECYTKTKSSLNSLRDQYDSLESKYNQISLKYVDKQKQAVRHQQIIKQLEQTKYSFLMKEERQRQQIQLLRKFTLSLKLNDQKINQFIQDTFGSQMSSDIMTGRKSFKQDISYILHLIKKKQNIYNEFIKQYQEKLRQTQIRCFLLEKKMYITDGFIKKIDDLIDEVTKKLECEDNLNQNQNKNKNKNKKFQINPIYILKSLMQTYKLDRRIV